MGRTASYSSSKFHSFTAVVVVAVVVSSGPNSKDLILLFVPCERAEQAAGQFVSKTNEQSGEPNQRKGSSTYVPAIANSKK